MADASSSDEIITIRDFSYKYPSAPDFVLNEINLTVRRGEFLGVMGPTGAGKTTFCLALNGIVPHFYGGDFFGSVAVAGLDTIKHPTYEMAQHVGMVFQDPEIQLTAPSVGKEIAFALENLCVPADEIRRRIPEALELVRLEGMEERHPHQLSGGQKQRLAIAAALALRPDVLVLDEPTSQLDPVGTDEVFAVVRELNRVQGITIIMVSHASEEVAEYADRVILLAGGRLLAESAPSLFFQNLDLLQAHDVRPPEITRAFEAMLYGSAHQANLPVTMTQGLAKYEALKSHLALRPAQPPANNAGPVNGEAVLQTRDLQYRYGSGTLALQGISLDFRRGEYVAIVGQNGAGKSTLVRHFLGLIQATDGQVNILGRAVSTYTTSELARHIGYISQNPDNQIFCDSVKKEVEFALVNLKFSKAEVAERSARALKEMNLEWAVNQHPLTLSKGDRSRIVIAAILAMNPSILIFDEPTTGQDYKGARAILDLTRELHHAGRTIIIITHHLYLLPGYAERLIVMGRGQALLDTTLRQGFYATETLKETFLTPPQVIQLAESILPADRLGAQPLTAAELAGVLALP